MNLLAVKQRYGIVGRAPALDHALKKAIRVAPTDLTVLINGESGVGKEVFSKVIHQLSARKHNPFLAVNCGAIPPGTVNSELFGHEKGAFTGANSDRKGYFEITNKGTIFLDEVSELPLDTQAHLLRVLETGEFIRVGASTVRKTDVRVVAASNADLLERVKEGKFREDLYYRLSTVPIYIPPLRERKEDILLLFRKFARDCAERYRAEPIKLDPEAQRLILNYSWPGNIRQLKNVAEQLCVLSESKNVTVEQLLSIIPQITERHMPAIKKDSRHNGPNERDILFGLLFDMKKDMDALKRLIIQLVKDNNLQMPHLLPNMSTEQNAEWERITPKYTPPPPDDPNNPIIVVPNAHTSQPHHSGQIEEVELPPNTVEIGTVDHTLNIEEMEKQLITKALNKHHGRRREAAKELGISERTLYRKIKQYEM